MNVMSMRPTLRLDALRSLAPLLLGLAAAQLAQADSPAPVAVPSWVHAYAAFGQPKYPRGFAHFDYVDPDAPKGGTINLRNPDRRSSFDKYNPSPPRATRRPALGIFMFESLAVLSAATSRRPCTGCWPKRCWSRPTSRRSRFRLHPKARFSNGDPVTAADVKYSFESMSGKYAAPGLRAGAGRRGAGGGARRAHDALRPEASAPTTCCSPSAA